MDASPEPTKHEREIAELMAMHGQLGKDFSAFKDTARAKMEVAHNQTDALLRQIIELKDEVAGLVQINFELKLSLVVAQNAD